MDNRPHSKVALKLDEKCGQTYVRMYGKTDIWCRFITW